MLLQPRSTTLFTRLCQSGCLRTSDVLTRRFRGSTKVGQSQLLHAQIVVDPLPREAHLVRDGGHVYLFGGQFMNLLVPLHTLLMILLALLFLPFALTSIPGKRRRGFLWTGG